MKEHGAYSANEADSYESDREVEPLWHIENAYIRDLVLRFKNASILDVPVGTGRFLEFYGDNKVSGVDLSESMLAKAEERAKARRMDQVSLLRGSVTELPFSDAAFDLVICWRLLHLLPPNMLGPALAEMARVCRSTLCVQAYERAALPQRMLAKSSRWLRRVRKINSENRQLTPWSHIQTFSHSGDEIESAARSVGLPPPTLRDHLAPYEGTNVVVLQWVFQ